MARKFLLTWNAVELVDTEDQYTYAEWSWLLWLSGFVLHFGFLVPLATFGIWCTWNQRRDLLFLYLLIGFYAASVIAFYVVGRYRYPLVPPMILLAAAGILQARSFFRQASRRTVTGALVCSVLVAVFCNVPVATKDQMRATTHYNIAVELDDLQLYAAAIDQYQQALKLHPQRDAVQNNLGADYLALGQIERAIKHLEMAVDQNPDFTEAVYNLGAAYLAADKLSRAEACFLRLVANNPNLAQGHYGLGIVRKKQGRPRQAATSFRRAVEIDPRFDAARDELNEIQPSATEN